MISKAQRNMETARPDVGPHSAPLGSEDAPEQDAAERAGDSLPAVGVSPLRAAPLQMGPAENTH